MSSSSWASASRAQVRPGSRIVGVEEKVGEEVGFIGAISRAERLEEEPKERRESELARGHDFSRDHAEIDGRADDEIMDLLNGSAPLKGGGRVDLVEETLAPGLLTVVDELVDEMHPCDIGVDRTEKKCVEDLPKEKHGVSKTDRALLGETLIDLIRDTLAQAHHENTIGSHADRGGEWEC